MDELRAMVMRGGTSKGLYFLAEDLPSGTAERDDLLLRILGSPDMRQIDGMGGAHPLTSKVAIVAESHHAEADVDYLFLQVGVDTATVSDQQTCGNLLAGVGQFATERGLVESSSTEASVRIRLVNTGEVATARFPVAPDGSPIYSGDFAISGVPGTAAEVHLDFRPANGRVLPTGRAIDVVEETDITCVDAGMPVVVLRAHDLGVIGYESCETLEQNSALRTRLEVIRLRAGRLMGLGDVADSSVPKMTLIAPPRDKATVATRTFIPHRCHASIGVLGALSVAAACRIPGSVAAGVASQELGDAVAIEHPSGVLAARLRIDASVDGDPVIEELGIVRTARKLMDGTVFARSAQTEHGELRVRRRAAKIPLKTGRRT